MKSFISMIVLSFLLCSSAIAEKIKKPKSGEHFGSTLNDNIVNFGWKVESLRSSANNDIYYLKKNKWLLYCVVSFEKFYFETYCDLP